MPAVRCKRKAEAPDLWSFRFFVVFSCGAGTGVLAAVAFATLPSVPFCGARMSRYSRRIQRVPCLPCLFRATEKPKLPSRFPSAKYSPWA